MAKYADRLQSLTPEQQELLRRRMGERAPQTKPAKQLALVAPDALRDLEFARQRLVHGEAPATEVRRRRAGGRILRSA